MISLADQMAATNRLVTAISTAASSRLPADGDTVEIRLENDGSVIVTISYLADKDNLWVRFTQSQAQRLYRALNKLYRE